MANKEFIPCLVTQSFNKIATAFGEDIETLSASTRPKTEPKLLYQNNDYGVEITKRKAGKFQIDYDQETEYGKPKNPLTSEKVDEILDSIKENLRWREDMIPDALIEKFTIRIRSNEIAEEVKQEKGETKVKDNDQFDIHFKSVPARRETTKSKLRSANPKFYTQKRGVKLRTLDVTKLIETPIVLELEEATGSPPIFWRGVKDHWPRSPEGLQLKVRNKILGKILPDYDWTKVVTVEEGKEIRVVEAY